METQCQFCGAKAPADASGCPSYGKAVIRSARPAGPASSYYEPVSGAGAPSMARGESSHAAASGKHVTRKRVQRTALHIAGYTGRAGGRVAGHAGRAILRNIDSLLHPW